MLPGLGRGFWRGFGVAVAATILLVALGALVVVLAAALVQALAMI